MDPAVSVYEERGLMMKLTMNKGALVKMGVNTKVDHPKMKGSWHGYDGRARMTVGTGGITWSHAIGDSCMKIAGDHVEPGVSMANPGGSENTAVQFLSCVGNRVRVLNGDAKGALGIVTGTHGGVDHTMAWFAPEDLKKMDGSENFLITAYGQGLKVSETPDVFYMNLDPDLAEAMELEADEQGNLIFPVAAVIPSFLMGAGLGSSTLMTGDYDIMTQDHEANEKYGINKLRLGDFVAISDHDCENGPHYKEGAVSVGVIVHSDSFTSGHGPGVTMLATSAKGKIKPVLSDKANLADYKDLIRRD